MTGTELPRAEAGLSLVGLVRFPISVPRTAKRVNDHRIATKHWADTTCNQFQAAALWLWEAISRDPFFDWEIACNPTRERGRSSLTRRVTMPINSVQSIHQVDPPSDGSP
jgi:hypothetical protein